MSVLIKCKTCGGDVSSNAPTCPHCGEKIKTPQTATGLLAAIIIGLGIGLLLLGPAFCSRY